MLVNLYEYDSIFVLRFNRRIIYRICIHMTVNLNEFNTILIQYCFGIKFI